jgi:hypothetical protein
MANYFFNPGTFPEIPKRDDPSDSTAKQMDLCLRMIKRPVVDTERFQRFWERRVYALKDAYVMNP